MHNQSSAHIREIFDSIQGEGPYVGSFHTFVRFCGCNLNCSFCDTDFDYKKAKKYTTENLFYELKNKNTEAISLTGGEPLCEVGFLKEFLENYKEKLNQKIYLETNGTLYLELEKIINYIDIISMDIKLKSTTKEDSRFLDNEKFLNIASKKEAFAKVVFDKNIEDNEINTCIDLVKKHNTLLVLQPKMPMDNEIDLNNIFEKFYSKYQNIRLIPQVHKFLNLL